MADTNFRIGLIRQIKEAISAGDIARAERLTEGPLAEEIGAEPALKALRLMLDEDEKPHSTV